MDEDAKNEDSSDNESDAFSVDSEEEEESEMFQKASEMILGTRKLGLCMKISWRYQGFFANTLVQNYPSTK